jgi:large subunit ribosomal protein L4
VLAQSDLSVALSARNLKKTKVTTAASLNTYDVLNAMTLIICEGSIPEIERIHKIDKQD